MQNILRFHSCELTEALSQAFGTELQDMSSNELRSLIERLYSRTFTNALPHQFPSFVVETQGFRSQVRCISRIDCHTTLAFLHLAAVDRETDILANADIRSRIRNANR